jgi:hypothetical protein
MNTEELIKNCYINSYGFDFETFHIENSQNSSIHSENGTAYSIYDSDFKRNEFIFADTKSSHFELINHNGRNFLLGDKSCYPCSIVYKQVHGIKFLEVYVIPDGTSIRCTLNIQNSSVICNQGVTKMEMCIRNYDDFDRYLTDCENSFKASEDWTSFKMIITTKHCDSLNAEEMFLLLKKRYLLNPIEIYLGRLIFNIEYSREEIYHSIFVTSFLPKGFSYITRKKIDLKVAKSTYKIISREDFREIIDSFDQEEFETFLALDVLESGITIDALSTREIEDLFGIRVHDARQTLIGGVYFIDRITDTFNKVGLTEALIMNFYGHLKENIRNIENRLRISKGFKAVGTLFNENLLFAKISERYNQYKIHSQCSPSWLRPQRFDIYIEELNIAVEYNGIQHYEPIDYFGGELGFTLTQKRDQKKRTKCLKNNCTLIEIRYDQTLDDAMNTIEDKINSKQL